MQVILLPHLPDAFPPTSPLPAPAQSPAATSCPAAASAAAILSPASVSIYSLSPSALPFVSRGRDDSSPPASLDSPLPVNNLVISFRDVLLSQRPPAPSVRLAVVGTVVSALVEPHAPRSLTAAAARTAVPTAFAGQGWQKVESRRSRRKRLKAARPRRSLPADLADRCFNCLSLSDRAVHCRQSTRCFKCHALGHRSFVCPLRSRGGDAKASGKRVSEECRPVKLVKVWRPKGQNYSSTTLAAPMIWTAYTSRPRPSYLLKAATAAGEVMPDSVAEPGQDGARSRRARKRRASARERLDHSTDSGSPAPGAISALGSSVPRPSVHSAPPCVLDWTAQMSRAEDDLLKGVVVTVISDRSMVLAEEIAALIAPRLGVEVNSFVLRRLSSSSFILVLPNVELVWALVDRRPLLRTATFSIACKSWSRLAGSTGGVLPSLVEFGLTRFSIHARESTTAAQLLSPFAWMRSVHADTLGLTNLSVFQCTAWALDVASIPTSRQQWIVEPPTVDDEGPPAGKKTLIYPVGIHFSVLSRLSELGPDPPAPPPAEGNGDGAGVTALPPPLALILQQREAALSWRGRMATASGGTDRPGSG
jgi:hypothetical protein